MMRRGIRSDAFIKNHHARSRQCSQLQRDRPTKPETCRFLITSGNSTAAPALDERTLPLPEANLADEARWATWPEKRKVRAEMVLGAGVEMRLCNIGLPDPSDKYFDRLMSTPV